MPTEDRDPSARRERRVRRPPPGSAPGHLVPPPDADATEVHALAYGKDGCTQEVVGDLARLDELRRTHPVLWVDVRGFGDLARLRAVADHCGVHPLALADVVHTGQRPKLEEYDHLLFVVLRGTALDHLSQEQDALFLGDGLVLTFQERAADLFDRVRQRILENSPRIRASEADYLFYALIDAVIDAYFPIVDDLGDQVAELEDEAIEGTSSELIGSIHLRRSELLAVRRAIAPLAEVLDDLLDEPVEGIQAGTRLFLRDCRDHVAQLLERVDSARDQGKALMDLHIALVNYRTGEVTKVLTIIATIFIPLSFIAGVYGMNFSSVASPWNMPELDAYWGYPAVLGVMAALAIGLLGYFRHKGWIGRRGRMPLG
jgi:magnesium transporter